MSNKLVVTAEPGKQEVTLTRVFDAPRDVVFKAFTNPELVPQWWGPRGVTTVVDKMEPKKGGSWRFIQKDNNQELAFNGVYHDIVVPERIIYTFEFEPLAGHVLLETITFEELPEGKTKVIDQSVFQSVEDRDGMVNSGMESGARDTFDRLEELLVAKK